MLAGLVCVFPSATWGSFLSLYFQRGFHFLPFLSLSFCQPYELGVGRFEDFPEAPEPLSVVLAIFSSLMYILLFLWCLNTRFSISQQLSARPTQPYLPPSLLSPFGFVHRPFLRVLSRPFPFLGTLWPDTLRSGYSQFVLHFSDSGHNL